MQHQGEHGATVHALALPSSVRRPRVQHVCVRRQHPPLMNRQSQTSAPSATSVPCAYSPSQPPSAAVQRARVRDAAEAQQLCCAQFQWVRMNGWSRVFATTESCLQRRAGCGKKPHGADCVLLHSRADYPPASRVGCPPALQDGCFAVRRSCFGTLGAQSRCASCCGLKGLRATAQHSQLLSTRRLFHRRLERRALEQTDRARVHP